MDEEAKQELNRLSSKEFSVDSGVHDDNVATFCVGVSLFNSI